MTRATDFTTALGMRLADGALRRRFAGSPAATAPEMGCDPCTAETHLRLDPAELEAQADVLLGKRLREVAKLVPRTVRRLGPDARALVELYAEGHWPRGRRRHLEDAVGFCRFVENYGVRTVVARSATISVSGWRDARWGSIPWSSRWAAGAGAWASRC